MHKLSKQEEKNNLKKLKLQLQIYQQAATESEFNFAVYDDTDKNYEYGIMITFTLFFGLISIYKDCNEDDILFTDFILNILDLQLNKEETESGKKYSNEYRDSYYKKFLNGDNNNFGYFNFLKIYNDNKDAFEMPHPVNN